MFYDAVSAIWACQNPAADGFHESVTVGIPNFSLLLSDFSCLENVKRNMCMYAVSEAVDMYSLYTKKFALYQQMNYITFKISILSRLEGDSRLFTTLLKELCFMAVYALRQFVCMHAKCSCCKTMLKHLGFCGYWWNLEQTTKSLSVRVSYLNFCAYCQN